MARSIISVTTTGSFKHIEGFFERTKRKNLIKCLEPYGEKGVQLLAAKTPVDSGLTAESWSYEIANTKNGVSIVWKNSSMSNGVPVVILIRFGHATRNGGYVEANDFISPVVKDLFKEMADDIWKEVTHK